MLNLNKLKKSSLFSLLFVLGTCNYSKAVIVNDVVNIEVIDEVSDEVGDKANTEVNYVVNTEINDEVNSELKIIIDNIEELTNNIPTIISEFEKIDNSKMLRAIIVGIIKSFQGEISFKEIQELKSLEKHFNEKTPVEILEFTTKLISSRSEDDKIKIKIKTIQDQINKTLKINIKTTQTTTSGIDAIKQHSTIQKMFLISKNNPAKLEQLLNHIIDNALTTNNSLKNYFNNIINKIGTLLS